MTAVTRAIDSSVTDLPSDPGEQLAAAVSLTQSGRFEESLPLWSSVMCSGDEGLNRVRAAAVEAMSWRDLRVAGGLAQLYAAARWGSSWWPGAAAPAASGVAIPDRPPRTQLSVTKLGHDVEQFGWLRRRGELGPEFDGVIDAYRGVAERLLPAGPEARFPLEGDDAAKIGRIYNRVVHMDPAPRSERALSSAWDPAAIEDSYLSAAPGLVVIDDFLSPEVLKRVQRFCLASTIWSGTRYAEGRLGAFFVDGFSAPILLQIAEELRAAFPRVIGDRHPLRQMWGFKYSPSSGRQSTTHADFAAVNVNFWITPTTANLDPDTGGLVVYDLAAPLSWDFKTYNERPDIIDEYLRSNGSRAIRIPYRENRAIVFNSDLFHATEPIHFRPEYEHRRINVTMLYGDRVDDEHHPAVESPAVGTAGWRSSALSRARH